MFILLDIFHNSPIAYVIICYIEVSIFILNSTSLDVYRKFHLVTNIFFKNNNI